MRAQLATGTVLAGFRVESLIGEGANGSVYLAERIGDGRRVALKLLEPELARDERFRRRFLRESQLAASLDHPHIVSTLASGEQDGHLYLVMAYVEGSDLRQVLRSEGRLGPERALGLIEQVAEALDAAHSAGLVHRDVKPANILVSTAEGEQAYVCDFGLARHVSSVSSLTSDRGFVGTIDYVSPEQIEGGPIDGRADVYSLGCVLYECLAGERPFDRETELSVLFAHLNEPPTPLSNFRPELPETLDSVFETALAKAPEDRYSTCADLVAAARAALEGRISAGRRKPRRRRTLLVVAAVVVAAAAAAGGVLGTRGTSAPSHPTAATASVSLRPNGLSLISARTRRVVARVGLGKQGQFGTGPWDIGFFGGSAWVLLGGVQRLDRVDLATRKVTRVVTVPWSPGQRLAIGAGSVWLTQDGGSEMIRVDARNGKVLNRFAVSGQGAGVAYGAGSLWVARGSGVARLDPESGRVLRRISVGQQVSWVAYVDGSVWAAGGNSGFVAKIDPVENRITQTARLHGQLTDLAVGGGFVWASIVPDGTVFQLSEQDLSVQKTTASGPDPERISFGGGSLWIANSEGKTVSRLDPDSGTRFELATGSAPSVVRYDNGLLWTGTNGASAPLPAIAGQDLRISMPKIFTDGADPSTSRATGENVQLYYATCANLLDYPDSAGAEGSRLRPELAAAMPTLSADGRTYTFRVRHGVRFSPPSKELVTPVTFRHTIERALSPKITSPPGLQFASDIVGVARFRARKAAHISGIAVHGDSLSITLLRPSGDFLKRISIFYFCPVPLREPVVPGGLTGPIPSLGPYYVASITDNYTVLLRNPNYKGHRPRRSARIVYTFGTPTSQAVALTDAGKIDLLPSDYDSYSLLTPGGALDRGYGPGSAAAKRGDQRYFLEPMSSVVAVVFNANRPLFRDSRLRRAASYALNRRALAAAFQDAPDDQLVSSAVRGFRAGRIYPVTGPDFRTARRLAGHRKRHAVLYAPCGSGTSGIADIIRSNLARIGITVSIVRSDACLPLRYDPRIERADLLLAGFGKREELDPEPSFDQLLARGAYGSALGAGLWSDSSFRARVDRARALRGQTRIVAFRALDDELMRAAPVAVFASDAYEEFVSPRVGCKLFQAAYGLLDLGALCVRGG